MDSNITNQIIFICSDSQAALKDLSTEVFKSWNSWKLLEKVCTFFAK